MVGGDSTKRSDQIVGKGEEIGAISGTKGGGV